jgi:hypothetical protein
MQNTIGPKSANPDFVRRSPGFVGLSHLRGKDSKGLELLVTIRFGLSCGRRILKTRGEDLFYSAATSNKRLQRTRHGLASLLSCVGEPLKRNVRSLENRKCVAKEESQNGTTSVGSDLSLLLKEVTPYLSTSRHSHAVIAGRA